MARFRFPPYPRKAHSSGQARIKIRGKAYYLGVHGSLESHKRYQDLYQATVKATPPDGKAATPLPVSGLLLFEVFAKFIAAMVQERGENWRELQHYRRIALVVDRVCPRVKVKDFGSLKLAEVRDAMISGSWLNDAERKDLETRQKPIGWCRSWTNQQIVRLRTVVRWAEGRGLAPAGSWQHLRALRGLFKGQANVRHSKQRGPVDWATVEATLPHLQPTLQAAVLTLWWTGARPSEIVRIRANELVEAGENLEYRPENHKTAHLGAARLIVFGPQAVEAIRPLLERARRHSPVSVVFPVPEQYRPKARISHPHSVGSLSRAVKAACKAAGVEPWTPYQIRHAAKERITRVLGLDAARAALGHRSLGTTNGYAAGQDTAFAREVAKKCG